MIDRSREYSTPIGTSSLARILCCLSSGMYVVGILSLNSPSSSSLKSTPINTTFSFKVVSINTSSGSKGSLTPSGATQAVSISRTGKPVFVSVESERPSPSVSERRGSVPVWLVDNQIPVLVSSPSITPSSSVSESSGSVPVAFTDSQTPVLVSTKSERPSSSVSAS